jgi:hypothetical protein
MKNSSWESEGNSDDVLDFVAWHVEVGRDVREAVPCLEAVDQVLDPSATVDQKRLSEGFGRADRDALQESHPRGLRAGLNTLRYLT